MTHKIVIIIAGAGASGKTTTTQAFVHGVPEEYRVMRECKMRNGLEMMQVIFTLYHNCAITGNHKSGTDSNTGPGIVEVSFRECMKRRDIVIVDGMVSSPRWVLMCKEWVDKNPKDDISILLVHFDIKPEETLRRLANRRGVTTKSIYAKMMPKCIGLTRRAELLVNHVYNLWDGDIWYLQVKDKDSTKAIVNSMNAMVKEILG